MKSVLVISALLALCSSCDRKIGFSKAVQNTFYVRDARTGIVFAVVKYPTTENLLLTAVPTGSVPENMIYDAAKLPEAEEKK